MKKWVTPELFELKAEWTENNLNSSGVDSYGDHVHIGDETIDLGSCKT